jgi:exonuclease V gamma subunit
VLYSIFVFWDGTEKQHKQAALADAFHNVPSMMWSEDFSLNSFRNFLESYQQEFSQSEVGVNYPKMFDKLLGERTKK